MAYKPQKFNPDGQTEIVLRYDPERRTFWATQRQIAQMFGVDVRTVNEHVKNLERELNEKATIRKFRIVQIEGSREVTREVAHYNHELILVVGFRCQSVKARQYQRWATEVLFREIMQEKRDEERDSYRPIRRTLRMAVDYSTKDNKSRHAFATIQDMMHYAAVGATAAGIIYGRASAHKNNIGLTTYAGKKGPTKDDVRIAKNYLFADELELLSKIAHGFMLSIEIAVTGRKKHQYTLDEIIDEFRDYLIKYHQDVLLPHMRRIRKEDADEYAFSQLEEYRRLLKANLPAIQSGELQRKIADDIDAEEALRQEMRRIAYEKEIADANTIIPLAPDDDDLPDYYSIITRNRNLHVDYSDSDEDDPFKDLGF